MKLRENPDMGRKVFFINPPYKVKTMVIPDLRTEEYEIYVLDDFTYAKNVLRLFPASICYFNIDEDLQPTEWFKYIRSFSDDEVLKTIHIGILSNEHLSWVKELFILHTDLASGFIPIITGRQQLTETFTAILDMNGAKGKRKYVRADCQHDKKITANCTVAGITVNMVVKNISTVGFCCTVPLASKKLFQTNSVIRHITLVIHDREIVCHAAIIIKNETDTHLMLVLLFLQGIAYTAKASIRNYITAFLQRSIHLIMAKVSQDTDTYSTLTNEEYELIKNLNSQALDKNSINTKKENETTKIKENSSTETKPSSTEDFAELIPAEEISIDTTTPDTKSTQSSTISQNKNPKPTTFKKDDLHTTQLF